MKFNKFLSLFLFGFVLVQPIFSQTVKTVGATGADYSNLRTAFNAINSGAISGNIELQIISSITDNNTAKLYGSGQVGEVTTVLDVTSGSGYVLGDVVTFSPPQTAGGVTATGRVSRLYGGSPAGRIWEIEITNPGSGYTSAPTVSITSATGTGANPTVLIGGNYTAVSIYPTVTGAVLQGSLQAPIIDLIGADNVTIDGRVNRAGVIANLQIQNTNSLFNSFTYRAFNEANFNTIKFCKLNNSRSERVLLTATTNGVGVADFTIENCIISVTSGAPTDNRNGISISGNTSNQRILIKDNEFVNLLSSAMSSISLWNSPNLITIEGNHFYQTESPTLGANPKTMIRSSGTNILIKGNYMGGSARSIGGSPWSYTDTGMNSLWGILLDSGSNIIIEDNIIGNFNLTMGGSLFGIQTSNSNSNVTIRNNTFGSLASVNPSIVCTNCTIEGMSLSSNTTNVENNTIGGWEAAKYLYVIGRFSGSGNITGNTIGNLKLKSNATTFDFFTAIESRITSTTISNNYIYGMVNEHTFTTTGINVYGGTVSNNIINLDASSTGNTRGISKNNSGTLNLYHNTVVIGGSVSTGDKNSFALFDNTSNSRNYRNNIFVNNATNTGTATGKHYAIALTSSPSTIDYNNYYASGASGVLGLFNNVDKATLTDWKASTTRDCFSTSLSPGFPTPSGVLISNFLPTQSALVAQPIGTLTTDYLNTTRSLSAPAMGALEYTVTPSSDVFSITSFTPSSGAAGTVVTITGVAFTGVTSVRFNGVNASSFTVVNSTTITATAPSNVSTGKISVISPCGTILSSNDFTFGSTPSAPTNLSATAGNGQVEIAFTAGADGGAAITNYEYSIDGGNTWIALNPVDTTSPITISGLTNGTQYSIQIRAVNSVGAGAASTAVTVTPTLQVLTYTMRWNSVSGTYGGTPFTNQPLTITFTNVLPQDVTPFPIISGTYQVVFPNGRNMKVTLGTILTNVSLDNVSANSSAILASSNGMFFGTGSTTSYGGDRGFLHSFATTPPTSFQERLTTVWNSNSSAVTSQGFGQAPRLRIAGLDLNIPAGQSTTGAWGTAIGPAPVITVPDAPTNLSATAGNGEATITFTAGADGGAPITNYEYSIDGGNTWIALNPADVSSPITITGLTNGTQYNIQIRALNSVGAGASSAVVTVTPIQPSTITVTSSLTAFSTCTGSPSTEQSFTVSGTDLSGNVTVTAPTGYQVSLTSGSGFANSVTITASGTLSATPVYVRLASTANAGTPAGNITVASQGATPRNVAVTGTINTVAQLTIQNSLCASQGLYWSTWNNVTANTATGTIGSVGVTVTHSNGGLSTTPEMFQHATFPSQYSVPNGTTLRNDLAGTFTFTFDTPVNNPQVAFSSIGNPFTPVGLTTSVPYQVLWNGSAMTYTSSTAMTGAEGFTIVSFPGTHTSITIQYNASETYANIAFGAENFNCAAPAICNGDAVTLTASGGSTYSWSPSTGLSGTTTAQVVATPTVTTTYTVIDTANPCAVPATITITVNDLPASPTATATQLFCPGATVATLQATAATGQTIEWFTTPTGGTALASTTALVAGTYYVQAENTSGCNSLRTPVVVATNNSLDFDGINDFVEIADANELDVTTAFTMEAWVYPTITSTGQVIFGKINDTTLGNAADLAYALRFNSGGFRAEIGNGTTSQNVTSSNYQLNKWQHVAIVFDGANSGNLSLYINGVLQGSTLATGWSSIQNNTASLKLGSYGTHFNQFFKGGLDNFRIWNIAKTASEINALINDDVTGTETGLVANYNFNQGISNGNNTAITSILDNTTISNNGLLNNFSLNGNTSNFVGGRFPETTGLTNVVAGNTIALSHIFSGGIWSSATPAVATVNASTGVVTGVSGGTAVITYTLCGLSANTTVTVNALPTISSISNQILCANGIPAPINFVIADLETTVANLVITVTSSNAALLPVANISFAGSTGARTMNYTTIAGVFGSSTVTITIDDSNGGVVTETFTVQVDPDKIETTSGIVTLQAGTPIAVDSGLVINETNTINGALVSITNGFLPGDILAYTGTLPSGVTSSYNATAGVLTFTGNMTPSEAQAILRAVTINTTSSVEQDRTVTFTLGSALPFVQNNHFYQFITAPGISWTNAKAAAEQLTFFGMQGYLTTVTSAAENQFILSKIQGQGWMGASDEQVEGVWRWMTGPEAGQQFWQGAAGGSVVNGLYNNWASGEPNNAGNEDYAHFLNGGQWNDYPLSLGSIQGYVVEFGGLANDPCVVLSASKVVEVIVNRPPTISSITSPGVVCPNTTTNAISFTIDDENTPLNNLVLTAVSSNTTVVPTANIVFSGTGNNRTVVVTPAANQSGSATITITVRDSYNTTASSSFTVTFEDTTLPTVITRNITAFLDANGQTSITAAQVNNGSTDNCGIASVVVSRTNFNCSNVGPNTVTLTVTDVNGNVATATAIVTVAYDFTTTGDNDLDGLPDNCDADDDNDGILDVNDNCTLVANANQLDTDGDGIGNTCDDDDDNDGINDGFDNCSLLYNPGQEDRDNDGFGDVCDTIEINVAQAITPNGDGINDTWIIYNIENHPNHVIRLYNRWGNEVMYARNYQNDWSGNFVNKSNALPSNSYYYQIDLDGNGTVDNEGWIYITQ